MNRIKTEIESCNHLRVIGKVSCGIKPSRIYNEKININEMATCLQKINYTISDLNRYIKNVNSDDYDPKDIVCIINLSSWIVDAYEYIQESLLQEYGLLLVAHDDHAFNDSKEYLKTVRSFVIAHHMYTNRHFKLGFDDKSRYMCIDIGIASKMEIFKLYKDARAIHLGINGYSKEDNLINSDFYLQCVNSNDDIKEQYMHLTISFEDIYSATNMYSKKLQEADKEINRLIRQKGANNNE